MERTIIAYKNVFDRDNNKQFDFDDMINGREEIFKAFGITDYQEKLEDIRNTSDKEARNIKKREYLPAIDLSMSGVLSIDIDNIFHDLVLKEKVIKRLKTLRSCHCVMESVSGNVVAFFKYDCSAKDFPFLYYKIYLELTLLLSINIDFLPEIGRLRYLSMGEVYHYNEDSEELDEIIECEELPYINTQVKATKARRLVFGSN